MVGSLAVLARCATGFHCQRPACCMLLLNIVVNQALAGIIMCARRSPVGPPMVNRVSSCACCRRYSMTQIHVTWCSVLTLQKAVSHGQQHTPERTMCVNTS